MKFIFFILLYSHYFLLSYCSSRNNASSLNRNRLRRQQSEKLPSYSSRFRLPFFQHNQQPTYNSCNFPPFYYPNYGQQNIVRPQYSRNYCENQYSVNRSPFVPMIYPSQNRFAANSWVPNINGSYLQSTALDPSFIQKLNSGNFVALALSKSFSPQNLGRSFPASQNPNVANSDMQHPVNNNKHGNYAHMKTRQGYANASFNGAHGGQSINDQYNCNSPFISHRPREASPVDHDSNTFAYLLVPKNWFENYDPGSIRGINFYQNPYLNNNFAPFERYYPPQQQHTQYYSPYRRATEQRTGSSNFSPQGARNVARNKIYDIGKNSDDMRNTNKKNHDNFCVNNQNAKQRNSRKHDFQSSTTKGDTSADQQATPASSQTVTSSKDSGASVLTSKNYSSIQNNNDSSCLPKRKIFRRLRNSQHDDSARDSDEHDCPDLSALKHRRNAKILTVKIKKASNDSGTQENKSASGTREIPGTTTNISTRISRFSYKKSENKDKTTIENNNPTLHKHLKILQAKGNKHEKGVGTTDDMNLQATAISPMCDSNSEKSNDTCNSKVDNLVSKSNVPLVNSDMSKNEEISTDEGSVLNKDGSRPLLTNEELDFIIQNAKEKSMELGYLVSNNGQTLPDVNESDVLSVAGSKSDSGETATLSCCDNSAQQQDENTQNISAVDLSTQEKLESQKIGSSLQSTEKSCENNVTSDDETSIHSSSSQCSGGSTEFVLVDAKSCKTNSGNKEQLNSKTPATKQKSKNGISPDIVGDANISEKCSNDKKCDKITNLKDHVSSSGSPSIENEHGNKSKEDSRATRAMPSGSNKKSNSRKETNELK